jgi:hypothetical protein
VKEWLAFTGGALPEEERLSLLRAVWDAQDGSARVNLANASNETIRQVSTASMDVVHSLASAMLATGGRHAPVTEARRVIFGLGPHHGRMAIVPGFGNSFHAGRIDPVWQPLADRVASDFPAAWRLISEWEETIGKRVRVNAAGLTATVAELVGWPFGLEAVLVIVPRLPAWVALHAAMTTR